MKALYATSWRGTRGGWLGLVARSHFPGLDTQIKTSHIYLGHQTTYGQDQTSPRFDILKSVIYVYAYNESPPDVFKSDPDS